MGGFLANDGRIYALELPLPTATHSPLLRLECIRKQQPCVGALVCTLLLWLQASRSRGDDDMTLALDSPQERNRRSLNELQFALDHSQGQFKLLFGHCNYSELRQTVVSQILAGAPTGDDRPQILELQVDPHATSLLPPLLEGALTQPYAVTIAGLETAVDVRRLLDDLNQRRELLRDRCVFPIVLWLDDQLLNLVMREIPDLESWATIYEFDVEPQQLLAQIDRFCHEVFERVMTPDPDPFLARYPLIRDRDRLELHLGLRRLKRSGHRLTPQLRASVRFVVGRRAYEQGKTEAAMHYFRQSLDYWTSGASESSEASDQWEIPAELMELEELDELVGSAENSGRSTDAASGEPGGSGKSGEGDTIAAVGHNANFSLNDLDQAVQTAQTDETDKADTDRGDITPAATNSSHIPSSALHIETLGQQGVIWIHLGLCQVPGQHLPDDDRRDRLQAAAQSLRRGVAAFEAAQRPELNAAAIVFLAQVLDDLEAWQPLQALLPQAIALHQDHHPPHKISPLHLAVDYLLLAEIALHDGHWPQVQRWATRTQALLRSEDALSVSPSSPPLGAMLVQLALLYRALAAKKCHRSPLLQRCLVQAQAQLAEALSDNAHTIDPTRYLKWLARARRMYLELGRYHAALRLKLKYQSIAQHYGFQVFVGIGQLKTRYVWPTIRAMGAETHSEAVSSEIQASGRDHDIEQLVDLLMRPDRKLIAIHGQSGVGKSSLVRAGLVPTLRRTMIAGRVVLPVVLGLYADWPTQLVQRLNQTRLDFYGSLDGLDDLKMAEPTSALNANDQPSVANTANLDRHTDRIDRIVQAASQLTASHVAIIFIFDQFEEFFFANGDPEQRLAFYHFLDRLLSVPFIKAALSIRDDCLHCLLESDRWLSMDVTQGDILNQAARYYLGNFSPEAAHNLIRSLTSNGSSFTLDADLTDELVRDLAAELSGVRPIELQIVGAQLQHERITSLEQYRAAGPKTQFVRRFLIETIRDCGPENETAAIALLFCLTDKNGTRPIRTHAELAQASNVSQLGVRQLDTLLAILCDGGLVWALPDSPAYRYQLVHDYFVPFIRQEQEQRHSAETEALRQENRQLNQDKELLEQLADAQERRQRSERKSRRVMALGVLVSMLGSIILGLLASLANQERQRAELAEQQAAFAAIEARSSAAKALWLADDSLNAIVEGLRGAVYLSAVLETQPETQPEIQAESLPNDPTESEPENQPEDLDTPMTTDPELAALRYTTIATLNPILQNVIERNRLNAHSNSILGVEVAPDGTFIASVSWDESLRVWSTTGRERYRIPEAHREAVTAVAIAPDSTAIATVGNDRAVKLWRATDGTQLADLKGHNSWVTSVAFSPDGRWLASADTDGRVILWDWPRRREVQRFTAHDDWILDLAFSPDSASIATASRDRRLRLWDLAGNRQAEFLGHTQGLTAVEFSPTGDAIVTASADGTAILWSSAGSVLKTFPDHEGWVRDVRFSPDGRIIATGDDRAISLWDRDGTRRDRLLGHHDRVWSLSFDPDGSTLVSASADNSLRLWSIADRALITQSDAVNSIAVSPDGQMLATSTGNQVELYTSSGKRLAQLPGHRAEVITVAFDSTGSAIVSAAEDGTARVWSVSESIEAANGVEKEKGTGRSPESLSEPLSKSLSETLLELSPEQRRDALNGRSGDQTGEPVREPFNPPIKERSPDSVPTSRLTLIHGGNVQAATFSSDGQTIATSGDDGIVRLWDAQTGIRQRTLYGHTDRALSVAFDPLNERLATASADRTVRLWTRTGEAIATLHGHDSSINWVVFSPDGQRLASASADNTIRIWTRAGEPLVRLVGHTAPVNGVMFAADGRTLVSVSDDRTVRLWHSNGKALMAFEAHDDRALSVALSPDHLHVFTASADRTLRRWDLNLSALIRQGCRWIKPYLTSNPSVTIADRQLCDGFVR